MDDWKYFSRSARSSLVWRSRNFLSNTGFALGAVFAGVFFAGVFFELLAVLPVAGFLAAGFLAAGFLAAGFFAPAAFEAALPEAAFLRVALAGAFFCEEAAVLAAVDFAIVPGVPWCVP